MNSFSSNEKRKKDWNVISVTIISNEPFEKKTSPCAEFCNKEKSTTKDLKMDSTSNNAQQAQYYNKLWSVQNLKSGLYAFCRGFADSLKFRDIFVLDSVDESKNYINEKNVKKVSLE